MAFTSRPSLNSLFEEPPLFEGIRRKSTFHSHTISTLSLSDKKNSNKIHGIKLDLGAIKIKQMRSGLRNIYANDHPIHAQLFLAETDAMTSNRDKGERGPKSILRKKVSNKESVKEVVQYPITSTRDLRSVKFDIKNNQVSTLEKSSKEIQKAEESTKCHCIIY